MGRGADFSGKKPAEPAIIVQRWSGTAQNTERNGQRPTEGGVRGTPKLSEQGEVRTRANGEKTEPREQASENTAQAE